jgi:putative flippase GtrA
VTTDQQAAVSRTATPRGTRLTSWVDRLPSPIRRFLPHDFAGYSLIGGCTFLLDLLVLSSLLHWTHLPIPLAVSIAYIIAFAVNYVLNRTLNFRSHAPVGGEVTRYVAVVGGDYALTIGVTSGLAAIGLDFRLARLAAGSCVGIFTYVAYRWWVFRH